MAYNYKTVIIGASGSGKTYAGRNLNRDTTFMINVENKPMPFKGGFKHEKICITYSDAYNALIEAGRNPEIKVIIFDSLSAYFENLALKARETKKGFDIWNMYNEEVGKLLDLIKRVPKEVFVIAHYEMLNVEGNPEKRIKAKGKEWEGVIEKEFTVALYADKKFNDKTKKFDYFLTLAGEGISAKCPPDIFGEDILQIPNDYQMIYEKIEEFKK